MKGAGRMKQCSKCEHFDRLYTKWKNAEIKSLEGCYCTTKFGICQCRDKVVGSTYICNEYQAKETKDENK